MVKDQVVKAAIILALLWNASYSGIKSVTVSYGMWHSTNVLDGFALAETDDYKVKAFHSFGLSSSFKLNAKLSVSAYLPFVISSRETNSGEESRTGIADLTVGLNAQFAPSLYGGVSIKLPAFYDPDGEPWLGSGSIVTGQWIQGRYRGIKRLAVFLGGSIEETLSSSRTKAGGLGGGLKLGMSHSFRIGPTLSIGTGIYWKKTHYKESSGDYGDQYTESSSNAFAGCWVPTGRQSGINVHGGFTYWGHEPSAGRKIGISFTKKFKG